MNAYNDSWFQNKTKEEIVKKINELRRSIRKKHSALKRETTEADELLEKQLKPISDPLKKLIEESGIQLNKEEEDYNVVKTEDVHRKRKLQAQDEPETPLKRLNPNPLQGVKRKRIINLQSKSDYNSDDESDDGRNTDIHVTKKSTIPVVEQMEAISDPEEMETVDVETEVFETQQTGEDLIRTPEGRNLAKRYIADNFTGKLSKEYFSKLITANKEIDHNYGVRVQGNDWMIGDKPLSIENDNIVIDGVEYAGTRGLYELIFMNQPNEYIYDEVDLQNYTSIVLTTNVYRVNFSALGKVRSNRGKKYKNIISQIIAQKESSMNTYSDQISHRSKTGQGIVLSNAEPNIIYYDDPNEIVDRLRLLFASQEAGNSGHKNEINAIMEELNELYAEKNV